MKKVLSVLLAAAMVMGMSVTSMAANFAGQSAIPTTEDVDGVYFPVVYITNEDGDSKKVEVQDVDYSDIEAGDVLYFPVVTANTAPEAIKATAPSSWTVKLTEKGNYIDGADFFLSKANDGVDIPEGYLYVAVTVNEDVDHFEEEEIKFYFYIHDSKDKTDDGESEYVYVNYDFADYAKENLTSNELDWVVTVDEDTVYTYTGTKAKKATIDFDEVAYGEFKMYPDESYTLAVDVDYNKSLSEEYDTDVEVIDFTLGNVGNIDLVLVADEDEYQVVAVVDGELVPVEAEYVEDYEFESGVEATGYVVEKAEYTKYALIDADVEVAVEEEVVETEPVVEEEVKANPETGASDFVGAAVALAVVSVAAAGALALKK